MLWAEFEERVINLDSSAEVAVVSEFLACFDLSFNSNVDYTLALYSKGNIVATGSLAGEVLRNIAIAPNLQGQGLTGRVVSNLIQEAGRRGKFHYFIFTKTDTAQLFLELGFKEVMSVEGYVTLLESGLGTIEQYCQQLEKEAALLPQGPRAAVVVNCNPFTLGHKAIIAKAAEANQAVIVFVLCEDFSLFPFDTRLRLVKEGLKEYKNVLVLPGSKYIISAATFPAYFTKDDSTIRAQTLLDANIFAKYIVSALKVTSRFVGEEPYCQVTIRYNEALREVLPSQGVAVYVVPRFKVDGEIISASKVREYIREDKWAELKKMVPQATYAFLRSAEASLVIKKIKKCPQGLKLP